MIFLIQHKISSYIQFDSAYLMLYEVRQAVPRAPVGEIKASLCPEERTNYLLPPVEPNQQPLRLLLIMFFKIYNNIIYLFIYKQFVILPLRVHITPWYQSEEIKMFININSFPRGGIEATAVALQSHARAIASLQP